VSAISGGPDRDLVFRASARLVGGNNFVWAEKRRGSGLATLRKFCGDAFEIGFTETGAAQFDGAVGFNQEKSRNVGQTVGVGNGIAGIVKQRGELQSIFVVEIFGAARVVLRNADDRRAIPSVAFCDALQKGHRKLADGARDFEEGQSDGAFREQLHKRNLLAIE